MDGDTNLLLLLTTTYDDDGCDLVLYNMVREELPWQCQQLRRRRYPERTSFCPHFIFSGDNFLNRLESRAMNMKY